MFLTYVNILNFYGQCLKYFTYNIMPVLTLRVYSREAHFFFENAGELRFIALEREKGPHTSPTSHTGTK